MRTYSHAILTYTATRASGSKPALAAALGATLPDIPMTLGATWLWTKKRLFSRPDFDKEVCGKSRFRAPDAALHSALAAAGAMLLEHVLRKKPSHESRATPSFLFQTSANRHRNDPTQRRARPPRHVHPESPEESVIPASFLSALLLGWVGHILTDFLTHGKDARPIFWPVSEWKLESPISYRERERHGRTFTIIEHATVFASAIILVREARDSSKS